METPKFYKSIQGLRALAALLVVLFHLRIVETKYGQGEIFLPTFLQFADCGVDLFFVISGFVMATIIGEGAESSLNAKQFFMRRAWRILPLYWVYTTLVVVLMFLAPAIVNSSYHHQSIVASYLLWPQHQVPILTVGWTLIHEVYFYFVIAFSLALFNGRHFKKLLFAWSVFIIVAQYFQTYLSSPVLNVISNPLTFEFIGGALIGSIKFRLPNYFSLSIMVLGILAFILGMYFPETFGLEQHAAKYRALVFGLAGVFLILGAISWERQNAFKLPSWVKLLGDSSFSLYLSHVFVISAVGRLWRETSYNLHILHHALFVILAIILSFVVAIASYIYMEKPLLKFHYRFDKRNKAF